MIAVFLTQGARRERNDRRADSVRRITLLKDFSSWNFVASRLALSFDYGFFLTQRAPRERNDRRADSVRRITLLKDFSSWNLVDSRLALRFDCGFF